MTYNQVCEGIFLSRPNRFIAKVQIDGKEETVHVKNTGRCRELLVPGCTVYLEKSDNPLRKTAFDLIAVKKQRENMPDLLINMDSQAPNAAAFEWVSGGLFSKDALVQREKTYGKSRFDLYIEDGGKRAFVEVKGVTLEENGKALFPDAPTERGVKHICELIDAKKAGFDTYILFVVQMKGVQVFSPNRLMHPEFADALRDAKCAGVNIIAVDCTVTPNSMSIDKFVKVEI